MLICINKRGGYVIYSIKKKFKKLKYPEKRYIKQLYSIPV